jgi:PAS domain S-box-containing protein
LAMQTPLVLKAATATDPGAMLSINGDTLGVREPVTALERVEHGWIWVIADGIGHEEAGVRASRLAAQSIVDTYWSSAVPDTSTRLREAVEHANTLLYQENQQNERGESTPRTRIGATILAAVVVNGRLFLAHVGRSRAYLFTENRLTQLTEDHSWVARQIRLGLLTQEQAVNHPRQNFITRALGAKETVDVDGIERELVPGEVILLCSDGLYRHLDDARIAEVLQQDGADAAQELVSEAKRSGASDNVTAVTLTGIADPIREAAAIDRVALIGRVSREIAGSLDLDETLRSVLRQLLQITGGQRAAVLLREPDDRLVATVTHNLDPVSDRFSHTVAREAIHDRRAILVGNALDDPRFSTVQSIADLSIRSILCAPLIVNQDAIGVLYVDASSSTVSFSQSDLDLLVSFASHAATAIQNARLHEEILARTREIELAQRRQNAIIRSLSTALVATDERGIVTEWNPRATEIFGRSTSEAIGMSLAEAVPSTVSRWLTDLSRQAEVSSQTILTSHEWEGSIGKRPRVMLAGRVARISGSDEQIQGVVFVINDRTDLVLIEEARRAEAAEQERLRDLFNRYLAPPVAEQLLHNPNNFELGGVRKDITVLFADVRGFTAFSEQHEPEQVVSMLNRYLTLATSEIFEQLGTLDKFVGDGVMAIFGAPLSLQHHAVAALRSAVAMRSHIEDLRRETGVRVGFGIGINSGSAIVGNIGSQRFMNYTAIGDVVNVAARLQAEARAGEILISDTTLNLVGEQVRVEELGALYMKGRSVPVSTYKVLELST